MSQANSDKPAKKTPAVVGARVGELEPLVAKWIEENPRVGTTHLVVDALKVFFKTKGYAGKRYAHLVEDVV